MDEELYSYNKDSDQWFCKNGNETIAVKVKTTKSRVMLNYKFEKETCRTCPYREKCIGKRKAIAKVLSVGQNASKYYEYNQFSKTEIFKEKYKKRARIEGKNTEMKHFHGLARANGYGLVSASKQAKLTAIAVNLKKIAKLVPLNYGTKMKKIQKMNLKILFLDFLLIFS